MCLQQGVMCKPTNVPTLVVLHMPPCWRRRRQQPSNALMKAEGYPPRCPVLLHILTAAAHQQVSTKRKEPLAGTTPH